MKPNTRKGLKNRLSRIEGQVRGLGKMLSDDKYCIDIITQSSAIRKALSSFEDVMLENHLSEHVIHQIKHNKEKKAVSEIIDVFKRAKNK